MRGFCLTFLFLGACGGASKPPDLGAGADLSGSPADLSASSSDLAGSPSDAAQPGDASQSGGGTVTLQVYNLDNNPGATFVMFEDGDGPWSALAATSPGLYTLHVTDGQGRYSFAAGDITQAPYARGFLLRAAVADGATQSVYFSPDQPTPNVSVSDTVAGIVSGDSVELEAGPGSLGSFVTSGSQTGLLAPGTYDFFAHKYTGATPGPIIYRPNVAISPSPSPAPSFSFDFGSAEPVALQSFAATVHGVPPGAAPQVETDLVLHDSLSQDGVGPLSRSPSGGTMGDAAGDYAFAMQLLPSPSPQPTQLVIASAVRMDRRQHRPGAHAAAALQSDAQQLRRRPAKPHLERHPRRHRLPLRPSAPQLVGRCDRVDLVLDAGRPQRRQHGYFPVAERGVGLGRVVHADERRRHFSGRRLRRRLARPRPPPDAQRSVQGAGRRQLRLVDRPDHPDRHALSYCSKQ
jgi:hypothetical protein